MYHFSQNVNDSLRVDTKIFFLVTHIDENLVHSGHPLILPAKDISTTYNFVADRFCSKLSSYKDTKLSHAARITLINSVFSSSPVHYMYNILFSRKLMAKLTSIIKNFGGHY